MHTDEIKNRTAELMDSLFSESLNRMPPIKDAESLRAAVLAYVNNHAKMAMPVTQVSRLLNRQAAKYGGTTVLELLENMHTSREVFCFKYERTHANWVISIESLDMLTEVVTDEHRDAPHRIKQTIKDRLQFLAENWIKAHRPKEDEDEKNKSSSGRRRSGKARPAFNW